MSLIQSLQCCSISTQAFTKAAQTIEGPGQKQPRHHHHHHPAQTIRPIGSAPTAYQPLDQIPLRDTFAWNSLLRAYLVDGNSWKTILVYRHMLLCGARPDHRTLPAVLRASGLSDAFSNGKQVHAHALKLGFASDSYVVSALMEFYGQFEGADIAAMVFSCSNQKNSVSWTLLAKLYLTEDKPSLALQLFHQMVNSNVELDAVALVTAARACGRLRSVHEGKKLHEIARKTGLESDVLVGNSLMKMYLECKRIEEARALFDQMPSKDAASWTTIISGYVNNGGFNEGLKLFRVMCIEGVRPDSFTVSAILPACARIAAHKHGMEIHGCIIRRHIQMNPTVSNALMDMYVKSGSVKAASNIFDRMLEKDAISWTVMIVGYSLHGRGDRGVSLFHHMKENSIVLPDGTTFAAALHACRTACMVEEGRQLFTSIKQPEVEHFAMMVSLLARVGLFDEARTFVEDLRIGCHAIVQRAMLEGCRVHRNTKMGKRIAEQLIELEPLNAENYVLMLNAYAANGKWDVVEGLREMIRDMGLKPKKAYSWIEVRSKVHVFGVGDVSHPRSQRIYWELGCLMKRMKKVGYVLDKDFSLHDVDEERECIPSGHSEMLAVAFGLISMQGSTTVRVAKNLSVCRSCHASLKMVSRVVGKEIVLKDPRVFHHFKDGLCSCRDMW
ncbi:pentatricopeptide repeat-containing protein At3g12770-like [Elaeis guineensis]|uniref:Pentatricopeptide repeat-containing protein At3g12770-like n=1 Tax=Elaeis guineensis var. tenera TaxID=51953 RepID=A0A6I9QJH9_ELAGV|nr:pentatricopeptide repeat-containing protein At3g12770-like [Elaeis guineensis]